MVSRPGRLIRICALRLWIAGPVDAAPPRGRSSATTDQPDGVPRAVHARRPLPLRASGETADCNLILAEAAWWPASPQVQAAGRPT